MNTQYTPLTGKQGDARPPAIVLAASGTANPAAREALDQIDAAARKRYPKHDLRWAFTSRAVVEKLRRDGHPVKYPQEILEELKQTGHASAVLQSLHVVPGQEYDELRQIDGLGLETAVGDPLLTNDDDVDEVIEALRNDLQDGTPTVIACHGNPRYPRFNKQLVSFAQRVEAQYLNVVVCSLEGQPGTRRLADIAKHAARNGKVRFLPLMIAAGTHVLRDVLGDKPDSWKNLVKARETSHVRPLGCRREILAVYFAHLDEALSSLNGDAQPITE